MSRNRETGGTGLGLSVARTIVLAHGGQITLTNRIGGGLNVEVHLPH
jgi:two-component system OmpR family sensor kinase